MADINRIEMSGRLARDPEFRTTTTGNRLVTFSMACNRSHKGPSGDWIEETTWIKVKSFMRNTDHLEASLRTGSRVAVFGYLELEQWTDQSGQKRQQHVIVASPAAGGDIFVIGAPAAQRGARQAESSDGSAHSEPATAPASELPGFDDDIF